MAPTRKTAANLIEEAKVYELLGIDREKCKTPERVITGALGAQRMVADNSTAGGVIYNDLQTALERLTHAVALQQTLPGYDPELDFHKGVVANILAGLVANPWLSDKEALERLSEKVQPEPGVRNALERIDENITSLIEEVCAALTNKVRVIQTTHGVAKVKR